MFKNRGRKDTFDWPVITVTFIKGSINALHPYGIEAPSYHAIDTFQ